MIDLDPSRSIHRRRVLNLVRLATLVYAAMICAIVVFAINRYCRPAFQWFETTIGDKPLHFLLVGLLTLLVNLSWQNRTWFGIQRGTLLMAVVASAEEMSQIFFVNRTFDLGDGACNLAGIFLLGSLAWPLGKWIGIRSDQRTD